MTGAAWFSKVSKRFGTVEALTDLTLEIPRGSVVGLLGRNGAGKTTALRCLVGLLAPDAGEVRLLDRDPTTLDVLARQRLGYQSAEGVPFPDSTAAGLIKFCAPLYPRWSRTMEEQILARFDIDPGRRLKSLSTGQSRAVGLLLAVCPQPDVLVLDEPAANLDAVVRRELLDTVLSLAGEEDRAVVFSSHILTDVERVADRIAILHHGRLRLDRGLDDLKEQARRLRFIFDREAPRTVDLPDVVHLRRSGRELLLTVERYDAERTAHAATMLGAHVEEQALGLEDLFVDLCGGERMAAGEAA
jgi:ABC-2 type transport system ATP-binding protein